MWFAAFDVAVMFSNHFYCMVLCLFFISNFWSSNGVGRDNDLDMTAHITVHYLLHFAFSIPYFLDEKLLTYVGVAKTCLMFNTVKKIILTESTDSVFLKRFPIQFVWINTIFINFFAFILLQLYHGQWLIF